MIMRCRKCLIACQMNNNIKPTILFVLPWLPYPLRSGGHQAIFNGIRAVKDDFNVIITYQEPSEITNEENKKLCNVRLGGSVAILPYKLPAPPLPQPVRFKTRVHRFLRKLFNRETKTAIDTGQNSKYKSWINEIQLLSKPFVDHVLSLIDRFKVDVVQCEMIRNAAFVYYLPDKVTKVFVHHEIAFVRQALEALSIKGDEMEKTACLKYAMAKEIGTLDLYDAVITLSQVDSDKLKQNGVSSEIFTSFAVVDTKPVQHKCSIDSKKLSFVGPSTSPPNIAAVKWFLENCWAALLEKDNYQLQIVGHWDESIQKEILSRYLNVSFTGFVNDLADAIKDTISIVPITVGSGIRMKILENAAIGVPIVSTTIGAEGLPFVNNEHCLIADTPQDFVNAIIQLEDEVLWLRLVNNASDTVKSQFSFDLLKKNRLGLYHELLARHSFVK